MAVVTWSYAATFGAWLGPEGLALRGPDYFTDRFAREWPFLTVAEDEAEAPSILGFAEVREGTLDMLFLAERALGRGIGRLLLADAERRGAIRLECFAQNAGALRFYEAQGWRRARSYTRAFAGRAHAFVELEKPQ